MKQLELFPWKPPQRNYRQPQEWKLVSLRECPSPDRMALCDTPEAAVTYWRTHVVSNPYYTPECEIFVVVLLNVRRRILGHHVVSTGILDQVLVHPREVFRIAIVSCAHAIVVMHNHPGGEPTPSEADIRTTRDLQRAGQLLKIEVLDHVIVGNPQTQSLRQLGHFYQ